MNKKKMMERIRKWEEEVGFADPKKAARLASQISHWKSIVFKDQ